MAARYLKIAAVYFVIAVVLGVIMGITQQFQLSSVHAHLNLLGWVSLALFGLIYHQFPQASDNGLAKTHFWLHNLGLPVMQGGLFIMILTNNHALVALPIIGSLAIGVGVILFAINIFSNVKKS